MTYLDEKEDLLLQVRAVAVGVAQSVAVILWDEADQQEFSTLKRAPAAHMSDPVAALGVCKAKISSALFTLPCSLDSPWPNTLQIIEPA